MRDWDEYSVREMQLLNREVYGNEVPACEVEELYDKVHVLDEKAYYYAAAVCLLENSSKESLSAERLAEIIPRYLEQARKKQDRFFVTLFTEIEEGNRIKLRQMREKGANG